MADFNARVLKIKLLSALNDLRNLTLDAHAALRAGAISDYLSIDEANTLGQLRAQAAALLEFIDHTTDSFKAHFEE